jgi:hypothetical protein
MGSMIVGKTSLSARAGKGRLALLASAMAAGALVLQPAPAAAGRNSIGGILGGVAVGIGVGIGLGIASQPKARAAPIARPVRGIVVTGAPRSAGSRHVGTSRNEREALATLANVRDDAAILRGASAAAAVTAGSAEDLHRAGLERSQDGERDYNVHLALFLAYFIVEKARKGAGKDGATDITQHSVERAIEKAYGEAKLATFERFRNENWTSERLKVLMLRRAIEHIPALTTGTNQGQVKMADVEDVINRSAQQVYRRLFETVELVAANMASARFSRRLYEAQEGADFTELRDKVEVILSRATRDAVAQAERDLQREDMAHAIRYRINRVVYDCLSEKVDRIATVDGKPATPAQMQGAVLSLANGECSVWVKNLRDADNKWNTTPLPARAEWQDGLPVDDPSLYMQTSTKL